MHNKYTSAKYEYKTKYMYIYVLIIILCLIYVISCESGGGDTKKLFTKSRIINRIHATLVNDIKDGKYKSVIIIASYSHDYSRKVSFMQPLNSDYVWVVRVPQNDSIFEMDVLYRNSPKRDPIMVRATIEIELNNKRDIILEKMFYIGKLSHTKQNAYDGYFISVSLSSYRGKEIKIHLRSKAIWGNNEKAKVIWGNPTIYVEEETELPNIIIICVDTLRRDRVQPYDENTPITPYLNEFAKDSVVFLNAVSQSPWTSPSVISLFSGMYPSFHRGGKRIPIQPEKGVDDTYEMTARLKENIEKKDRDTVKERRNVRFGNYYLNKMNKGSKIIPEILENKYINHAVIANVIIGEEVNFADRFQSHDIESMMSGKKVNRLAYEWLNYNKDKLFFLYLHYMEPHQWQHPFIQIVGFGIERAVKKLKEKHIRISNECYNRLVQITDSNVGEFLESLKKEGLYDPSLIIFYSDHGEHLLSWEHETKGVAHGHNLTTTLLNVPLIVKFPYSQYAGQRIKQMVKLVDVFKTIIQEAGAEADECRPCNTVSLREVIEQQKGANRFAISEYLARGEERVSIQNNNYRVMMNYESNKISLFSVYPDNELEMDLYGEDREVKRLKASLIKYIQLIKNIPDEQDLIEADEEFIEKLRNLGYIQ